MLCFRLRPLSWPGIAALALVSISFGCKSAGPRADAEPGESSSRNAPTAPDSPTSAPAADAIGREQQKAWADFREQIRRTPWPQVDRAYLSFARAIPTQPPEKYREYLKQTRDVDPNLRANGAIGITACDAEAAEGRLAKLLDEETDPNNRTMIVWCLRYTGREHALAPVARTSDVKSRGSAGQTLWDFLGRAKDVDFGVCLDQQGHAVPFRSPFALAGVEAFKALIALKGTDYMLDGPGWDRLVERLGKSIDPQPYQIDAERLRPESRKRESEKETLQRLMKELDEP